MGVEVTKVTTDHADVYDEETRKLLDETTAHSVVLRLHRLRAARSTRAAGRA
jgi:hypothetical protein